MSDIRIEIEAQAAQYQRAMNEALRSTGDLSAAIKHLDSVDLRKADQEIGRLGGRAKSAARDVDGAVNSINSRLSSIETSARVAAAGTVLQFAQMGTRILKEIGESTIGTGVRFNAMGEQAQIAFTQMLGSGEKAQKMLADLRQLAIESPLEFPQARQGAQTLLAMGFAGEKVVPIMRTLTDAASAFGGNMGERINGITIALGQMANSVHVNAQDMNQLIQQGLPAWQALSEAIGKSVGETRDMAEKGLITGPQAVNAVLVYIHAHMAGLAAEQGRTLGGLFASMKDLFAQAAGGLLEPFTTRLRTVFEGLVDTAQGAGFQERLKGVVTGINDTLNQIGNVSSANGLNLLDASLVTISARIKETFGQNAGNWFDQVTQQLGNVASQAGTTARSMWDLAQKFAAAAVNGTSFADTLGPVGSVLDRIRDGLDQVNQHREVLTGLLAAFVAFEVLSTVIPIIIGFAAAVEAVFAAFAVGGAAAGVGAIVTLLGGPLALAIVGVSVAMGALVAAWATNWGDIQTKAEVAVRIISGKFEELSAAVSQLPGQIGGFFDQIGTRIQAAVPNIAKATDSIRDLISHSQDTGAGLSDTAQSSALTQLQTQLNTLDPSQTVEAVALINKSWASLPPAAQDAYQKYAAELIRITLQTQDASVRGTLALAAYGVALRDLATQARSSANDIVSEMKRVGDEVERQRTVAASMAANAGFTDEQRRQWADNMRTNQEGVEAAAAAAKAAQTVTQTPPPAPQIDTGLPGGGDDKAKKDKHIPETAVQGFMRELVRNAANFAAEFGHDAFGKAGAEIASDLAEAIASNAGSAGSSVARSMDKLISQAEEAGIPGWRALGDDLAASFMRSLETRLDGDKDAALGKLHEFVGLLQEAAQLNPENFQRAFDLAQVATRVGDQGKQILTAFDASIKEGTIKSINDIGAAVQAMHVALLNDKDLTPEQAADLWTRIWAATIAAIEQGGEAGRASLQTAIQNMNLEAAQLRVENILADKLKAAGEQYSESIRTAGESAARDIQAARDSLQESRNFRDARENVTEEQRKDLDNVVRSQDMARFAWHDYFEELHRGEQQARDDAELRLRRSREDEDIALRLKRARQDVNSAGGASQLGRGLPEEIRKMYEAAGQAFGPSQIDQVLKQARRAHEDLVRQRSREDADIASARTEQERVTARDRGERLLTYNYEKGLTDALNGFKLDQAKALREFEDAQGDVALQRDIDRIHIRQAEAEKAAELVFDKAQKLGNEAAIKSFQQEQNVTGVDNSSRISDLLNQNAGLDARIAELQNRAVPTLPSSVSTTADEVFGKSLVQATNKFNSVADKLLTLPEHVPSFSGAENGGSTGDKAPTTKLDDLTPQQRKDLSQGFSPSSLGLAPLSPTATGSSVGTADATATTTARTGGAVIQDVHVHIDLHGTNAIGIPGGLDELARILSPKIEQAIKANVRAGG